MALSLAELLIICLLTDYVLRKWGIPGLTGILLVGVALGPEMLNWISPELQTVSSDLRTIALLVILLRAGFELSKKTLKKVGGRALLFSCVPAAFEGIAIVFLGHWLLKLTYLEAAILGSVLAAVSPAVVVPLMIEFMEQRKGTKKGIPTLILAASSIDDVFVIVVYGSLIGLYTGEKANLVWKAATVPISIIIGVIIGLIAGYALLVFFRRFRPRATKRLLVVLGISIFLLTIEHRLEGIVPFAALLAVMTIGVVILEKDESMAHQISAKLSKLWVFAEIVLFALVGARVNVHVALHAGGAAVVLILLALVARSVGSWICMLGSDLTTRERIFVVIAYLPKATVQAAIGGAPLLAMKAAGMDTGPGEIILAVAALSILLTAPAGAWAIRVLGNRFLEQECLVPTEHIDITQARQDVMAQLTVGDAMDPDPAIARCNDSLQQLLHLISTAETDTLPVVKTDGSLEGVVHLANLKPVLASPDTWQWLMTPDVMTQTSSKLSSDACLADAQKVFDGETAYCLPVTNADGKFVGLLHKHHMEQKTEHVLAEWLVAKA